VKLHANNSTVNMKHFSSIPSTELSLSGAAVLVKSVEKMSLPTLTKRSEEATRLSLCSRVETNADETFSMYWSKYLCVPVSRTLNEDFTKRERASQIRPAPFYSAGAVWLSDQKYVAKGFFFSCSFLCDWTSIDGTLLKQHFAHRNKDSITNLNQIDSSRFLSVGSVSLCLHSDRRGSQVTLSHITSDSIATLPDSVAIGVTFIGGNFQIRFFIEISIILLSFSAM